MPSPVDPLTLIVVGALVIGCLLGVTYYYDLRECRQQLEEAKRELEKRP